MASISVTGTLQQAAWKRDVLPPVEQVREHIWSIPVPFPGNPMRYTLCYLIMGSSGAVIVDPGWRSATGLRHLLQGLRLAGVEAASVTGIVLTHYHPDHIGLAVDVARVSGAWIAIGKNEPHPFLTDGASDNAGQGRLDDWGVPADVRDRLSDGVDISGQFATLAHIGLGLGDGDRVPLEGRNIQVIETPGHTRGHICLHEADSETFFSGDHVLPRISPHISLEPGQSQNPLRDYYNSLDKTNPYAASEVLPAHEYRFHGLQHRTQQLRMHHEERTAEIQRVFASRRPQTVWETAQHLTWSRGWDSLHGYSLNFALAETAAHLAYLEANDGTSPDPYGKRTVTTSTIITMERGEHPASDTEIMSGLVRGRRGLHGHLQAQPEDELPALPGYPVQALGKESTGVDSSITNVGPFSHAHSARTSSVANQSPVDSGG